jgi:hypothetical protein
MTILIALLFMGSATAISLMVQAHFLPELTGKPAQRDRSDASTWIC